MGATMLLHFILALSLVTFCFPNQWLHQIYVNNRSGAINNKSCWKGGYSAPCHSLNMAFRGARHYKHSVAIFLQPGKHNLRLSYSGETELRKMSQLAIVGNNSEGEVTIECDPSTGLAFFWSKDLEIRNVTLVNCGALRTTTSLVAMFFTHCKEIQLTHVHIFESTGSAVVIYNPKGVISIEKCNFSYNGLLSEEKNLYRGGGGGLTIEANEAISRFSCIISNSTFTHNVASFFWLPAISLGSYFRLGKGGGISVVFREGTANNTIQLNGVHLGSNKAQGGGGFFLAFHGNTSGNVVSIDGAEVKENQAWLNKSSPQISATGGGIFIGFAASKLGLPFDNNITVSGSIFISNKAETGGGMTVDAPSDIIGCTTTGNKLVIEKCVFDNNEAFRGASVYMSQNSKTSQGLLDTMVCCSNFTNGHCNVTLARGLLCSGDILLEHFPLVFKNASVFANNSISAISLYSSSIELLPSAQLQFINNSAVYGAALYNVDCSSIILNNNTAMLFVNNTASHHGDAIYVKSCSMGLNKHRDCFVRHRNSGMHPDKWNVNLTFIGANTAIYIDSVQSCILGGDYAFCWKGWHFVSDCQDHLKSGVQYIEYKGYNKINPGDCINLKKDFSIQDYWGHDMAEETSLVAHTLVDGARIVDSNECQCHPPLSPDPYTVVSCSDENILVLPNSDNSGERSILIHPPELPGIIVQLSFQLCEHGMVFNKTRGCVCDLLHYAAECTKTSSSICTTSFDNIDQIFTNTVYSNGWGMCGSCNDTGDGVAINSPSFICAKCSWYSVAIFVFVELVPMFFMMTILAVFHINITDGRLNAYVFYSQLVSVQFPTLGYSVWLPTTQYFMNTGTNSASQIFVVIPLTVYSIWNLNFLNLNPKVICMPHIDTAARVIGIQYFIAACPLIFIIVTYVWIRWYTNGYRFVVFTTKPVHQLLARFWHRYKIQPSLIDTYAGLFLLSFMCFLVTSIKSFYFIYIDASSATEHTGHATLGVAAVLCLLVFVVPQMAVLLFYHLKIFQRCLTWCKLDRPGIHALLDAYQGCFKNSATDGKERRYFAGLYLLFRFCFIVFVVFPFTSIAQLPPYNPNPNPYQYQNPTNPIQFNILPLSLSEAFLSLLMAGLVVILQPYRKTIHNVIDFLMLLWLTVIGISSIASSILIIIIANSLIHLPSLIFICFLFYRLLKFCCCCSCSCCCCKKQSRATIQSSIHDLNNPSLALDSRPLVPLTTSEVTLDDCEYVPDDLYPDRMVSPGGYNENNQYQPLQEFAT